MTAHPRHQFLRTLKISFEALTGPVEAEHPGTIHLLLHLPIMLIDSRDVLLVIKMQWLHFDACEAPVTRMFTGA